MKIVWNTFWAMIAFWVKVLSGWVVLVSGLVCWFLVSSAFGHSREITECSKNIPYQKAVQIGEGDVRADGLFEEQYDTNSDGRADIIALSAITQSTLDVHTGMVAITHAEHPSAWVVDRNYDGQPDELYADFGGQGRCEDIHLWDLKSLRQKQT